MAEPNADPVCRCPSCGFENAPNSLYCQDCGAKLESAPPSYLTAQPAQTAPAAAPVVSSRGKKKPRILTVQRERQVRAVAILGTIFRTLVYAAFVAGLIQLFRPPRNMPPPSPSMSAEALRNARGEFTNHAQQGFPVDASWVWINTYLSSLLAPGAFDGAISTSFVRAAVRPHGNGFTVIVEKDVSRLPIYMTVDYRVVIRSSGLSLERTGAAIGRVPLPAGAAPIVEWISGDLGTALKFELDILQNARSVQFAPATVHIAFSALRP